MERLSAPITPLDSSSPNNVTPSHSVLKKSITLSTRVTGPALRNNPSANSSLVSFDVDHYATTIQNRLYTAPSDQPPTNKLWTRNLKDVPPHRRDFYPKLVVPRKDLPALDATFCSTATMAGLDARRQAADRIREQAQVVALQASMTQSKFNQHLSPLTQQNSELNLFVYLSNNFLCHSKLSSSSGGWFIKP